MCLQPHIVSISLPTPHPFPPSKTIFGIFLNKENYFYMYMSSQLLNLFQEQEMFLVNLVYFQHVFCNGYNLIQGSWSCSQIHFRFSDEGFMSVIGDPDTATWDTVFHPNCFIRCGCHNSQSYYQVRHLPKEYNHKALLQHTI